SNSPSILTLSRVRYQGDQRLTVCHVSAACPYVMCTPTNWLVTYCLLYALWRRSRVGVNGGRLAAAGHAPDRKGQRMKTWHKGSRLLAATAALCLAVAGCGGGGTASGGEGGDPQKGGTLTYALNVEVNSVDPAFCALAFERCAPIFGTLMRYDLEAEKFVGNMAKSFESKDGKQWTLKLRKGVEFTDGTPYDAEAVVYN